MRTLEASLASAQEENERFPLSKVEVYDSLLRWTQIDDGADFDIDDVLEVMGVASAGFDADIYDDEIWIAMQDTGITLRMSSFISGTFNNDIPSQSNWGERPSVYHDITFSIYDLLDPTIRAHKFTRGINEVVASLPLSGTWGETEQWHALAAVSETAFYHAWLTPSGASMSDFAIGLEYVSDASTEPEVMNYTIPVEAAYSGASLSWFDAVRMSDGTDVIVINTETYGKPEVILRSNGVFSDRMPMIPIDLVDNYSYLRIGWMKIYDGVIYATGELGRRGSTGLHPQSMAVVLRSIDGIHWSLDRWRYLGETPFRSPLLLDGAYAYYLFMPDIYRAPLTPLFGFDSSQASDDHIYFEVESDILNWSSSMPGDRQAGQFQMTLNDAGQKYTNPVSDYYIRQGYMLKLFGGYKTKHGSFYQHLGWYGIDTIRPIAGAAIRSASIACREWNLRCMTDNLFDQDWQWLSPTRHYDNCGQRSYLYSIGGSSVRTVSEVDLLQVGDEVKYTDEGNVKIYTEDRTSVIVSTTPFDADDGFASVGFLVNGRYASMVGANCNLIWRPGLNEYGLRYSLADQNIGTGAGPAIIKDEHNYITCFLDMRTRNLILLRVTGDEDGEIWEQLDIHSVANEVNQYYVDDYFGSQLYEPWIEVRGNRIRYGLVVTMTGYEWHDPIGAWSVPHTTIQGYDYDPNSATMVEYSVSNIKRNGENRFGIVTGTGNPFIRLSLHAENGIEPMHAFGRSLLEFNYGNSIVDTEDEDGHMPYYVETGDFKWDDFRDTPRGFSYLEGLESARGLMHLNVPLGGSYIPMTQRGDFCTGLWEIQETSSVSYGSYLVQGKLFIDLDPDECYPEGEDADYWLNELGSSAASTDNYQYSGFWFTDGNFEGRWLPINTHPIAGTGDNVRFELQMAGPPNDYMPEIGDKVIFSPGAHTGFFEPPKNYGAARIFRNPEPVGVTIRSFIAYDLQHEKPIRWLLKDIVTKTGVIEHLGGLSDGDIDYDIDLTFTATGKSYISDDLKDFDLHVELSEPVDLENTFSLLYGGRIGSTDGMTLTLDMASDNSMQIALTSSLVSDEVDHFTRLLDNSFAGAKNLRFVKNDNFISTWIENYLAFSYPTRKRWKDTSFSPDLVEYNRVGFDFTQSGATFTVKQDELWTPVDAVYSSQGSNAIQASDLVISDAHIKILPDQNLAVRISLFDSHDEAGTLPDIIFSDRQVLTDALPTHIRATGIEIGEYFDHEAMAQYGVSFMARTVESLSEEEAYREAKRTVQDIVGINEGRSERIAAQLHLEPEDEVFVSFISSDGQVVSGNYIINTIQLAHDRPAMEMVLSMRKKYAT